MVTLDAFIGGSAGLFDELLAYQHTLEFGRDLRHYWQRHKELLDRDQDARRLYHQEWAKYNRGKVDAINRRREERRRALPDTFTEAEWQACLDYWGYKCAICGRSQGLWWTIAKGHWIPLAQSVCPGTVRENIIPICNGQDGCNNKQHAKLPAEWLSERYTPLEAKRIIRRVESYFAGERQKKAA